jgi:hypothetical protein
MIRFAVIIAFLFGIFGASQSATAQESSPTLRVQVTMEEGGQVFTPSQAVETCGCSILEVAQYVDGNNVVHQDGVIFVGFDRFLEFRVPAGFTGYLFGSQMTRIDLSDQEQVFPAIHQVAVLFHGPTPTTVRMPYNMNPMSNDYCDNCAWSSPLIGTIEAFSYDDEITDQIEKTTGGTSPRCSNYDFPEGVVVQFSPNGEDLIPTSGPISLPHQCGMVWVFTTA